MSSVGVAVRLLCLDASTAAVTVALVEGDEAAGAERAAVDEVAPTRHGEMLAPAVRRVLAASPGPVDAVAVGVGPGPYTSLRVGVATAAALADGWGVPAYAACSLDLLAAPDTVVVQDARRREVYWAAYDRTGRCVQGPGVLAPADLVSLLPAGARVVGAGAALHADVLGVAVPVVQLPRAAALWGLVAERLLAGAPGEPLTPLYLRRPDALPAGRLAGRKSVLPP